jgi:hypothetical protein
MSYYTFYTAFHADNAPKNEGSFFIDNYIPICKNYGEALNYALNGWDIDIADLVLAEVEVDVDTLLTKAMSSFFEKGGSMKISISHIVEMTPSKTKV